MSFDYLNFYLTGLPLDNFKATGIAALLNTIVFHTRMVDQLEDMLVDTSDLSLFCFYMKLFEEHFQMCLEFPAQNRPPRVEFWEKIISFYFILHYQILIRGLMIDSQHHQF